ncbi:MAG TPA: nucleotidyltransferase domain-containing protein [Patescibacteria group bacterium]|nr:nucleotidyltransferase domain-containing protein [Patescibacteria group bacterium]
MLNLYSIALNQEPTKEDLDDKEKASILYHNLFDYPLSFSDLIKWKSGNKVEVTKARNQVTNKRGFYFLEGREGLIYKRLLRKRVSDKKMKIAKASAKIFALIPTIKMVAVTGSLAMENAAEESDIDLMMVTKKGTLWITRLLTYLLTYLFNLSIRKPSDNNQKDKFCLNIWLDETDLLWSKKDRNVYTAHEIAQIIPLVNKDKTYEKFLHKNKWLLDYWPNSVKISEKRRVKSEKVFSLDLIEKLAFNLQKNYMMKKVTREIVTPTRALFHPQDWGKVVLGRLT